NLLAGYANLVGSDGRVISFTKKDGTTEQGILLPKKFNFKDNVRQDFAIKDANDAFKLLKSGVTDILKTGVASRKGDIRIVHNTNTGGITIYTPKSKSTGGKWFLNKKLIDVVGDFVSSGNMMVVNVPSKKAIDALSIVIEKTPLYVLPSQAEATKELLGYYDGQVNLKSGSNPQDSDSKPKFSQSSTIGDRTTTQVREKLVKHFGEKIISLLEKKGILKIHQSLSDESVPNSVKNGGSNTDGAYDEGVIHLIADNLTDETILGTFVHELGVHKGFQEMMSPKAYELIMQQFYRLVAQGNAIAIKAKQRAERAEVLTDKEKVGKTDKQIKELEAIYRMRQQNEYIPYLLTEQEKAQLATPQERNAVQRLIDHIVRAVKGWVVRTLSKYDTTYKM
ncbi:MAG TPA: hypothetical protein PKL36_13635, partial [Agitococcus sp.]|nr:hypothetical protein [Agitococcus sp.]